MKMRYIFATILSLAFVACHDDFEIAEDAFTRSNGITYEAIHVSPTGDDTNDGMSYATPVKSIERAIELSATTNQDWILLMDGEHRCEIKLKSHEDELRIESYPGERATISGLEEITTQWSVHSGNIWVTTPNIKPQQLFEQGKMLNAARYPNVDGYIEDEQPLATLGAVKDGSILDLKRWIASSEGYYDGSSKHNGTVKEGKTCSIIGNTDGYAKLSDLNYSVAGAHAIMNIASYKSYYTTIDSHTQGSNEFTYTTLKGWEWRKPKNATFYLEGKLEMLDQAGEWFYDTNSDKLYVYCKDGGDPNSKRISGKTQTYAVEMSGCSNLTFKGIDFVGTTIFGTSCSNIQLIDCDFKYPSYSKRMLREQEPYLDSSGVYCVGVTGLYKKCNNNLISNCTFRYTEGEAFVLDGDNNIFQNNTFEYIDISCANLRSLGGTILMFGSGNIFRQNYVAHCAASATLLVGDGSLVEYNNMHSIGYLEGDGSIVQIMQAQSPYTVVRNNWLHDTEKLAVRVDAPGDENYANLDWKPGEAATYTTVVDNVIWNGRGIMLKGDYHVAANNTLFTTYDQSLEEPCTVVILVGNEGANANSVTINNLSDLLSGWHRDEARWEKYDMPEECFNNYMSYYTKNTIITDLIQDAENFDFRPYFSDKLIDAGIDYEFDGDMSGHENSHTTQGDGYDIGAVEYNPLDYKIPGVQQSKSSSPIPADGSTSKSSSLMIAWRNAWESTSSKLYMGTSSSDLRLIDEVTNSCYYPSKKSYPMSERVETIYWRVDCVVNDEIVTGDTWSFSLQ